MVANHAGNGPSVGGFNRDSEVGSWACLALMIARLPFLNLTRKAEI